MTGALTDVLEAQQAEQRRRAVRTLLRRPLLAAKEKDRQAFTEVRRHAGWLSEWFARETGWTVQADHSVARLRKIPADQRDGSRGAVLGKQPFSRRRYVLACLALAALERAESQVTLGWLVDRILGFARDDDLAAAGITFTLQTREEQHKRKRNFPGTKDGTKVDGIAKMGEYNSNVFDPQQAPESPSRHFKGNDEGA